MNPSNRKFGATDFWTVGRLRAACRVVAWTFALGCASAVAAYPPFDCRDEMENAARPTAHLIWVIQDWDPEASPGEATALLRDLSDEEWTSFGRYFEREGADPDADDLPKGLASLRNRARLRRETDRTQRNAAWLGEEFLDRYVEFSTADLWTVVAEFPEADAAYLRKYLAGAVTAELARSAGIPPTQVPARNAQLVRLLRVRLAELRDERWSDEESAEEWLEFEFLDEKKEAVRAALEKVPGLPGEAIRLKWRGRSKFGIARALAKSPAEATALVNLGAAMLRAELRLRLEPSRRYALIVALNYPYRTAEELARAVDANTTWTGTLFRLRWRGFTEAELAAGLRLSPAYVRAAEAEGRAALDERARSAQVLKPGPWLHEKILRNFPGKTDFDFWDTAQEIPERPARVLRWVSQGYAYCEIAKVCGVDDRTVETWVEEGISAVREIWNRTPPPTTVRRRGRPPRSPR